MTPPKELVKFVESIDATPEVKELATRIGESLQDLMMAISEKCCKEGVPALVVGQAIEISLATALKAFEVARNMTDAQFDAATREDA